MNYKVMRPLHEFSCQNENCEYFCKEGLLNITQRGWCGKTKEIRLLRCSKCGARFSERKGTALSDSRIPVAKSTEALRLLDENISIRQTARLTGLDKNTVSRLAKIHRAQKDAPQ